MGTLGMFFVPSMCGISLRLVWLTLASQRIRPVKGSIRDHKEFWGLSPNVTFENCDVNPVSGPFNSVFRERRQLRVRLNRYNQDRKCSEPAWNIHIYSPT